MAVVAIDTFVTTFALVTDGAVHCVAGFLEQIGVKAVFAEVALCNQVTILQVPRGVVEVAVLHRPRRVEECEMGHDIQKFLELIEERS
jgi:hypothetical protein